MASYWTSEAGRKPFVDFLSTIRDEFAAQILGDLRELDLHGIRRAPVSAKPIKGYAPMWELRVGAHRVFFFGWQGQNWILGGCKKQDQKREIENCAKRMRQLMKR